MDFAKKLARAWEASGGSLCVGLDPIIERMPSAIAASPRPVLAFNRYIVDLVGDLACAFKPQFAHHAAVGAEEDLAATIDYIHQRHPHAVVILDAKRGDVGSTAEMYAREAFDRYDADAVTVNPYMGDDTVTPFLGRPDRCALVLCRTSNPDADRFQDADLAGVPVFEAVARRAEETWSRQGNVMLVVGRHGPGRHGRRPPRRAKPRLPGAGRGRTGRLGRRGEEGGRPRRWPGPRRLRLALDPLGRRRSRRPPRRRDRPPRTGRRRPGLGSHAKRSARLVAGAPG